MSERIPSFLEDLRGLDYEVIHAESFQAVVCSPEEVRYVIAGAGDWIQASQTIVDGEDVTESARAKIAGLALRVQSRFLGCRFCFGEDGSLNAVVDIFPGTPASLVRLVLGQLGYIAASVVPLFAEARVREVCEDRIELALGPTGASV